MIRIIIFTIAYVWRLAVISSVKSTPALSFSHSITANARTVNIDKIKNIWYHDNALAVAEDITTVRTDLNAVYKIWREK